MQSGDVTASSAVIWRGADRPARMVVEWATNERFGDARRVVGAAALPESGSTAKTVLDRLPSAQDIFYRVTFVDLRDARSVSAPGVGRVRTAPSDERDVTFAWSGDTVGQGWGINAEWGGLRLYDAVRATAPDFFVHCGDLVYADDPLRAEVPLPGGSRPGSSTTPATRRRAVRCSRRGVSGRCSSGRRSGRPTAGRVYRGFRRGPLLDLFLLDMRSDRGPNGDNREATLTDDARILGAGQVAWLKRALAASRATWKVIAADQPLGLVIHFSKPPPRMNTAPSDGHLYFGHVRIDGRTRVMTVRHHDLGGAVLHETRISPSAAPRRRA